MTKFLEKQSNKSFLLRVIVKPNSKKQEISSNGDVLIIKVRSNALKNKANREVIKLVSKKLKISSNQLHIAFGLKNTNKVLQAFFPEEKDETEVINMLLN